MLVKHYKQHTVVVDMSGHVTRLVTRERCLSICFNQSNISQANIISLGYRSFKQMQTFRKWIISRFEMQVRVERETDVHVMYALYHTKSLRQDCHESRKNNWLHLHFTFMHLADTFIQSDLQCIKVIYFLSESSDYIHWIQCSGVTIQLFNKTFNRKCWLISYINEQQENIFIAGTFVPKPAFCFYFCGTKQMFLKKFDCILHRFCYKIWPKNTRFLYANSYQMTVNWLKTTAWLYLLAVRSLNQDQTTVRELKVERI